VFQHASDHTSSHSFHAERRKVEAENSNLQKDVQQGASLAERKEKEAKHTAKHNGRWTGAAYNKGAELCRMYIDKRFIKAGPTHRVEIK
jgi:hypothetical protein